MGTTKEFYTEKWHYTIIDAPGHRDFIKNMITGASQADVALIMVPADGNFTTAIAKGNHKAGEIQGQTRQHSRLINLLGVKQICIGVNKMDCDTAGYKKEERERGVTIACTTKEFYTEKWHYTIIDAPGHRDFIKNMITGASQADVALIM